MELPVISTTTSGIPELITDLKGGLIVKPNDPSSLADAFVTILDNPAVSRRIGKEARSVIRDSFEFRKNSGRMRGFFTEILGERAQ